MKRAIAGALALFTLSGCYLSHPVAGERETPRVASFMDASASDAGPPEDASHRDGAPSRGDADARGDADSVGNADARGPEAEPPSERFCSEQCAKCARPFDVDVVECVRGCSLRFDVARGRGCDADFEPWIDCIAREGCESAACLALRSCW